jgi:hypothetical protein
MLCALENLGVKPFIMLSSTSSFSLFTTPICLGTQFLQVLDAVHNRDMV